jgi:putative heme iron utilization protein
MDDMQPRREAARLISTRPWLALSTVDRDGTPALSCVPFAVVDGTFGIVASRLAAHTANLLARRPAAILLVDGDERSDAYAQPRFSIAAEPLPRTRGSADAEAIWSALETRHGQTVQILRTLPDFEPIALRPIGGRLVLGFASAHDLDAGAIVDVLHALTSGR